MDRERAWGHPERDGKIEIELEKGKNIERGPNREIERDRWR